MNTRSILVSLEELHEFERQKFEIEELKKALIKIAGIDVTDSEKSGINVMLAQTIASNALGIL